MYIHLLVYWKDEELSIENFVRCAWASSRAVFIRRETTSFDFVILPDEDGFCLTGKDDEGVISVDHRVSDGAEAAQFMQALAGFLENPVRMLV
jgi:pyruvate/2-oxoglutarate dehydrogenase complex dihydrolipoamide acyltransferase (E2) component